MPAFVLTFERANLAKLAANFDREVQSSSGISIETPREKVYGADMISNCSLEEPLLPSSSSESQVELDVL